MRKICFGKNIFATNGIMTNLTNSNIVKNQLQEVYRMPENLIDINGCFKDCKNFTTFQATIPESVKYMSSSFEGCVNFYQNISIPNACIDMTRGFKNSNIKGTVYIPENVMEMQESFLNSSIKKINFVQREHNDVLNNIKEAFKDCNNLVMVEGEIPSTINFANEAFSNTSLENINFLKEEHYINIADGMFQNCRNLKFINDELNVNSAVDIFNGCSSLSYVSNIKGNNFSNAWGGCYNLQRIGLISGNLIFNNSFMGINNYSNIMSLNPNSLSLQSNDIEFLNKYPLRIYGTGHGLNYERNFVNAHLERGDYISGYCDILDFNIIGNCFSNYNGISQDLCIPKYFRTNLLDSSTRYVPMFQNAFKNKAFNNVFISGGDISINAFENSNIENLLFVYFVNAQYSSNQTKINSNSFINSKINSLSFYGNTNALNIGHYAFQNSTINNGFFPGETALNNGGFIYFNSVHSIGTSAFSNVIGNLKFETNIHTVYDNAFNNFKGSINIGHVFLGSIVGNKIRNIGDDAFRNINGTISHVNIMGNIGNNAFYNSVGFNGSLSLDFVKNIGKQAFYNTSIDDLYIKNTSGLSQNAFSGMKNLKNLTIDYLNINHFGGNFPNSLKNVYMTGNNQDSNSTNKLYSVINIKMNSYVAPNQFINLQNLTYFYDDFGYYDIGDNAFSNCINLKYVYGNMNIGNIGNNAFNRCSNIISVGNNIVGNVHNNAFNGCSNLRQLNAFYVCSSALSNCYNINSLTLRSQSLDHIGAVWGYSVYNNQSNVPSAQYDEVVINYGGTSRNGYNYYVYKISPNLKSVNLTGNFGSNAFQNIKSLENLTFDYTGSGVSDLTQSYIVHGCSNLINYNIKFSSSGKLVDNQFLSGVQNVININMSYDNIDYPSYYYYISRCCNMISNYPNLNNVDFGELRFSHSVEPIFDNLKIQNYSQNITIMPDVYYNGYNISTRKRWVHANFGSNITVETNKIGIVSHIESNYYYNIPNYSMNLNGKTIYFDNKICLDSYFLRNRSDLEIWVEDIESDLVLSGSSNITIYYANINMKPNMPTSMYINNNGNNYYYKNNINLIYKPNYNFGQYVSNIK